MKITHSILLAALISCGIANGQNKANFTLKNGSVDSYNTNEIESIDFDLNDVITVNPKQGTPVSYNGTVSMLSFLKNTAGHVVITEAGGWFETSYVKWENMAEATNYEVYVKPVGGEYKKLDRELVRNYGAYGRADMVGITAGEYVMKVVPMIGGIANESMASETSPLTVKAHDRSGFAHFKYTDGIGAYNNDGTLKSNAKVFYITAETAKTVTTDVVVSNKGAVETLTGMQTILQRYEKGFDHTPLDFRIIGCVTDADMDALLSDVDGLQLKGKDNTSVMNVTFEGIGDDAVFKGFGLTVVKSCCVEIRNIGFIWFKDDGISLKSSGHLWVHNNDIFYGKPGSASDQKKGDGSLDLKDDSQYVTVSYNHFWDSGKMSLCGMKSETGPNWITYHHNWFDHSDSRHPRIRTMSVHVYNNYYDGVAKYGIGAANRSEAFVENNYFRNTKNPILSSKQGSDILDGDGSGTFSGEDGGVVKSFGNIMCGKYWYRPWSETNTVEFDAWEAPTRDAQVPSTVSAKQGGKTYSNWDTDPSLMYTYTPDAAADVPAIVKGVYGAGRINHGDFRWTFNNNIQDGNYEVIDILSTTLQNYDSWLVGFYGETIGNGGKGFTNPGGDATEGAEFPNGNGNAAFGSVGGGDDVEAGEVFIGNADGSMMTFGEESSATVQAFFADGTFDDGSNGSTYKPTFTNADYDFGSTGSIQLGKSGGYLIVKCPSISVFKAKMLRTGTYKTVVSMSTDGGKTYTEVATDGSKKGVVEKDWSGVLTSAGEVYVKIENNSSGGLNIVGLLVKEVKK